MVVHHILLCISINLKVGKIKVLHSLQFLIFLFPAPAAATTTAATCLLPKPPGLAKARNQLHTGKTEEEKRKARAKEPANYRNAFHAKGTETLLTPPTATQRTHLFGHTYIKYSECKKKGKE